MGDMRTADLWGGMFFVSAVRLNKLVWKQVRTYDNVEFSASKLKEYSIVSDDCIYGSRPVVVTLNTIRWSA